MNLHIFIIQVGTGIIVITFLVALLFRKKEKPGYFKYIFLFILSGLSLSLNTINSNYYNWRKNYQLGIFIEEILIIIQTVLIGLFFWEILKKSQYKKSISLLLSISISSQLLLVILVHTAKIEIRHSMFAASTYIILSLLYFKNLVSNNPTVILRKSSSFWVVLGIFFSACITIPILSLVPFIPKQEEYHNIRNLIFSFCNISAIIQYLLIIKAFICLKHPQTS